jgi:hypothetical protein
MATLNLSLSLFWKALLFIIEVSDSSLIDHVPAASQHVPRCKTGVIHYILIAFYGKFNFLTIAYVNSQMPAGRLHWQNHLSPRLIETTTQLIESYAKQTTVDLMNSYKSPTDED